MAGFLLANLQLNPAWAFGYALKLVGGLFMAGGIAELSEFVPEARRLKSVALLFIGACAAAAVGAFVTRDKSGLLPNIDGAVNQAATVLLALLFFWRLLRIFADNPEVFENEPLTGKVTKKFLFFAAAMGTVIAADIVNRIAEGTVAADAAGAVLAVIKIAGYILLADCGLGFNKLRIQFERTQERKAKVTDRH